MDYIVENEQLYKHFVEDAARPPYLPCSISEISPRPCDFSSELRAAPAVEILIDFSCDHPGAGSFYADGFFHEQFLKKLESLHEILPVAPPMKLSCSSRSYYCDSEKWVRDELYGILNEILREILQATARAEDKEGTSLGGSTSLSSSGVFPLEAAPQMRFLNYETVGGSLAPHVDLSRTSPAGLTSTHTFILYLSDCVTGGRTILLNKISIAKQFKKLRSTRGVEESCAVQAEEEEEKAEDRNV
eukprot:TRINITY_DN8757_c0_g1_i15.p2 TRINITY_DN8757_c0_g1~~TRINITY_DN8757_c0_g1_i15.p2  ORF type:complete len:245 (-),score=44.94 TRINITY_DN8757_c0_g1_i15:56-790(-)